MEARELILLPVLKANVGSNGGLILTQKYLEGAAEYARYWPGPVTTLAEISERRSTDMDHVEVHPGSIETGLEVRPVEQAALAKRLQNAALALAFLSPYEEATSKLCRRMGIPFVCVSESTPLSERQEVDANTRNPVLRMRRKFWLLGAERARQRMLPHLTGLQCSGVPTYDLYRPRQPNALLFFDNRVSRQDVIGRQELEIRLNRVRSGKPLKLVFGGRLIPMKGIMELPEIARALVRQNIPFSFDIYGTGQLENRLATRISELGLTRQMRLMGSLDFQTGWIPALKRDADLFVCCHLQGDPSSTYPEVMSCGVPIAGYDNDAFQGIVDHSDAGWLAPMREPGMLADRIARVHEDRDALAAAAIRARDFALQHDFETTFARRTGHLVQSSRLPERLKRTIGDPSPVNLGIGFRRPLAIGVAEPARHARAGSLRS